MSRPRGEITELQAAVFVCLLVLLIPHAARGQWNCVGGTCSTTGNVGIGTTSPEGKCQVEGLSIFHYDDWGNPTIVLRGQKSGAPYYWGEYGLVAAYYGLDFTNIQTGRTMLRLGAGGGTSDVISLNPTGGNIGIGTANPVHPLDISSGAFINLGLYRAASGSSYGSGIAFDLQDSAGGRATYADLFGAITTNTPDSEDGYLAIRTVQTGALTEKLRITSAGDVGIGTASPQHKLSVNGTIGTKEVVVTNAGWADYVLRPAYPLAPLGEVATYIKENQRLPGIPSAKEVEERGISLGDMQVKLLAKVEELTLHLIQLDERNRKLEKKIQELTSTRSR